MTSWIAFLLVVAVSAQEHSQDGGGSGKARRASESLDLNIYFTAEVRGRYLPVKKYSYETCDPTKAEKCYGGNARLITYIEEQKALLANKSQSLVFADLGGYSFGGPFENHPDYPAGGVATLMQNYLPYDFCLLGATDFLGPVQSAANQQKMADSHAQRSCPLLLANVKFNAGWSAMNNRIAKYQIVTMPNGWKVGFVGMFTHQTKPMYLYDPDIMDLDPNSMIGKMVGGKLGSRLGLKLNMTEFIHQVKTSPDFDAWQEEERFNLYMLGTRVNLDVLLTAQQLTMNHPDVKAMVLLMTKQGRPARTDMIDWMLENGPFDVIIGGAATSDKEAPPKVVKSSMYNKLRLYTSSSAPYGLSHLKVHLNSSGVAPDKWDMKEVRITKSTQSNAAILAKSNELYEIIRQQRAQSFGSITAPLVGWEKGDEKPPSKNQCFYTDCSAGDIVGKAMVWKGRQAGHKVDVSIVNLGGFRSPLEGDATGAIGMGDCLGTLKFQNNLGLQSILGKDLLSLMEQRIVVNERGFMGGGMRIAIHEPCRDFVDRSTYNRTVEEGPPGSGAEIDKCAKTFATKDAANVKVVDMEIERIDFDNCQDLNNCPGRWETLELGSTYTLITTDYFAGKYTSIMKPLEVDIGREGEVLCDYIKANSPLQVPTWEAYKNRDLLYETAATGFASGSRVPAVKTTKSIFEGAAYCPDGRYLPKGAVACVECPSGRKSISVVTRHRCDECAAGSFTAKAGMSQCIACPAGRVADKSMATACFDCTSGKYAESAQQSECNTCPTGQFSAVGAPRCELCGEGTFQDQPGQSACRSCDALPGLAGTSSIRASTSADQCICQPKTYWRPGIGCEDCISGLKCPGGQARPIQKEGYYVEVSDSSTLKTIVYQCLHEDWCPEGKLSRCEADRYGRSCAKISSTCAAFLWPLIFIALFVVGIISYRVSSGQVFGKVTPISMMSANLGICIVSMQSIGVFFQFFEEIPTGLQPLADASQSFTFNLEMVVPACNIGQEFAARYAIAIFPPLAIVLMFVLLYLVSNMLGKYVPPMCRHKTFNITGTFLQVMYVMQCKGAFSFFVRKGNPSETDTLQYFTDVIYGSDEHFAIGPIISCIYLLLAYVIGFFAAGVYAVYVSPQKFSDDSFRTRWLFLFGRWRPARNYWGLIWLFRNMFICLAPIIVKSDRLYRTKFFCAAFFIHALGEARFLPWASFLNATFEVATSGFVIALSLGGLAFTPAATKSEKQTATMIIYMWATVIWVLFGVSVGYVCWSNKRGIKERTGDNKNKAGLRLLAASAAIQEKCKRDPAAWEAKFKGATDHDIHMMNECFVLLSDMQDANTSWKRPSVADFQAAGRPEEDAAVVGRPEEDAAKVEDEPVTIEMSV